ncbi:MAG: transglycosylase domain-containing protein [Rubricoccaceae bacterium]
MASSPRYIVRNDRGRTRASGPPAGRRRRAAPPSPRTPARRAIDAFATGLAAALVLGLGLALALAVYASLLLSRTPDAFALSRATRAQPSVVLAAGGERLTQYEPPFREWVPLDSMPPHLVHALIATEDRAFYRHRGLDVRRTFGAMWYTLRGNRQGGSTITQQLARNLFPAEIGHAHVLERKVKEVIAAYTIERDNTKRDILESYLNTVPFLYNAHGVELAARTYFGTTARALTVPQAATLVAMLKGPADFNPVRNPERARARRDLVLRLMAEQGHLSAEDAARYREQPLGVTLRPQPGVRSQAPHFTAAVRARLEAWARPRGYDVERDGLVVHTTLDLPLQRLAEAVVAEQGRALQRRADARWGRGALPDGVLEAHLRRTDAFARLVDAGRTEAEALAALRADRAAVQAAREAAARIEASFVALDPATGAVRAYVGSRDFMLGEYDMAGVARRQPGSTFKPFVFAAALQRGYAPTDAVVDQAVAVDLGGGEVWRPSNSGRISGASLSLTDALAFSKNTVAVQLGQEVGPARVAYVARQMGITSPLDVVPSLALGTSPVTLLEMTGAYGTIANDGLRREPLMITRIESASGHVLARFAPEGGQAITRRDARALIEMMRAAVDRGTGRGVRARGVTLDVAGKTGTTQRNADGWFILMHPRLVAGAWVGFPDQRLTLPGAQGSDTALPIVADVFARIQDRLGPARFPDPPGYGRTLVVDDPMPDTTAAFRPDEPPGMDWDAARRDDYRAAYGPVDPAAPPPRPEPPLARPDVPDRAAPRPSERFERPVPDRPAAERLPAERTPRPAVPEPPAYTPAPLGRGDEP